MALKDFKEKINMARGGEADAGKWRSVENAGYKAAIVSQDWFIILLCGFLRLVLLVEGLD